MPISLVSGLPIIDPLLPLLPPADLVAAGVFLRDLKQPHWLLLQDSKHGEWGFPKGHVEPRESLVQAALRECAEESGIALVELLGPATFDTYTLPNGKRKNTVYFPARTATQEVVLSSEHKRARWCTSEEVGALLNHPGLIELFRKALREWPC
jgi:diadenosine hexaphosphate hydrolase (ATP-forming)